MTLPNQLKATGAHTRRLQEAAVRFHVLVEKSHDAIVVLDGDGRRIYASPSAERILGIPQVEMVGRSAFDMIHPDDVARARAAFAEVKESPGGFLELELRRVRRDGSIHWLAITATNLLHLPSVQGVVLNYRDITERKVAEETLRQSEARLRILVQTIPDLVWLKDSNGMFLFCNSAFERLYGAPEAAIVGRTDHDFVEKPLADFFRQHDQAAMAAGGPTSNEEWLTFAHDGYRGLFQTIKTPMQDKDGKLIGVLGVARDITERRRAAEALQQSEERHRQFFEHSPLPMWLFDLESMRFLAVNESAVQHYGYTREEFLAMTANDIRPEAEIPALQKALAEIGTRDRSTGTMRHRRKDGTIMHVEVFARHSVFDGRRAGLVLANDITEKKLLEEKFLHSQRLESVGLLAAGIAHDLNNVLAPIAFAAPLLRQRLSDPRDLKILDTLERCADRGAGLVKQVLGFVQTNTGELQPTQLKHLAHDVTNMVEETFPKSIRIEHHIPSDLWPVMANPTHIHQVLLNLCVNARDAMPQGGTLRVTATNRRLEAAEAVRIPDARPGAWVVLEVADTGTGIPPEVLARIWEPFFTTKDAGKGTGLGLATVRGIAVSHYGFVELQTEVGRGTTFRVFLPALESETPRQNTVAPFAVPQGQGELVLVADDETHICDLVSTILRDHGYRVVSCHDGAAAIALFATRPEEISVVITDVDMPRFGGVALARALLRLYPDVRILAMSGLPRAESGGRDLPEMQKLARAVLAKPFTAEDLLSTVHRLLHPASKS